MGVGRPKFVGLLVEVAVKHLANSLNFGQEESVFHGAGLEYAQSRLYVPCPQPPFGLLTAIDLETAKIVWQKPFGTAENSGPLDFKSHLPITIGSAPNVGGAITTRSGLTIIGAATDRRLRAIDTLTGKELWNDRLPEGNHATPITYLAPRTHKQLVAIVSGGHVDLQRNVATHVVAYGLAP